MESALYDIYALVVFVSEMERVRAANEWHFSYVNNSCVNTVSAHFPWSILYVEVKETSEPVLNTLKNILPKLTTRFAILVFKPTFAIVGWVLLKTNFVPDWKSQLW